MPANDMFLSECRLLQCVLVGNPMKNGFAKSLTSAAHFQQVQVIFNLRQTPVQMPPKRKYQSDEARLEQRNIRRRETYHK